MPEAGRVPLDEALPLPSFSFLVLDLAFRNERDLPGLIRYKLEGVLPRGLEGIRFFFRRVGKTRRFLVTLVKEPVPQGFVPTKVALPFALSIGDRDVRELQWVSHNAIYRTGYGGGFLASVQARAKDEADFDRPDGARIERRDAPAGGQSVQESSGRHDLVWRIAAAALGLILAAQLAVVVVRGIATREARLRSLEERIAVLSGRAGAAEASGAAARDLGLQSRARDIQRRVSLRWKPGYYLERWSMKGRRLRLEGWGPSALALLASLRSDPALAKLDPVSRKSEKGYETFAFEGEVGDD